MASLETYLSNRNWRPELVCLTHFVTEPGEQISQQVPFPSSPDHWVSRVLLVFHKNIPQVFKPHSSDIIGPPGKQCVEISLWDGTSG